MLTPLTPRDKLNATLLRVRIGQKHAQHILTHTHSTRTDWTWAISAFPGEARHTKKQAGS